MKKKMVLDGAICETCGCVIDTGIHIEKDPVTGHDIAWVCEKRLTVKMSSPLKYKGVEAAYGHHNIRTRKKQICPKCASRFLNHYRQWVKECDKAGEEERAKRILDFEQKYGGRTGGEHAP